jgi:predicted nucleic acid-binding protein
VRERWVVDASPLIVLGSIGRLDLLAALAEDIVVPEIVAQEVLRVEDEASRVLAEASLRTASVDRDDLVMRWGLGAGEMAVLSFAKHHDYVALVDDLAARRCASALGIPTRGTLGVVLLAKQRGIIASAAHLVAQLRDAGLYLSPDLIADALFLVGEREED